MAQEADSMVIKIGVMDIRLVIDALYEARLNCAEQDCFNCCNYAELERRFKLAIPKT